jgi:hypothetical protein
VRHGKNRVAATGIPAADHEFMQFRVAAEDLHPSPMKTTKTQTKTAAKKSDRLAPIAPRTRAKPAPKPAPKAARKAPAKPVKKVAPPAPKPALVPVPAPVAKKAARASLAWPEAFPTKSAIRKRLEASKDARLDACQAICSRHRARQPGMKSCGWMSSHEARGLACGASISKGEKLSMADAAWLELAIVQYARQLAAEARAAAIARNPKLAEIAKVYSLKEVQS